MNPLPLLRRGTTGPEVGNWQRFLNGQVLGLSGPLVVDENYGLMTAHATETYQDSRRIAGHGEEVDALTRKFAMRDGFISFVQAKYAEVTYPRVNKRTLIVIHTMENPEKPYQAENVALWFAGRTTTAAPAASAHYCIDEDSIVQCVRETDGAWHAGPVNGYSIGIEHSGYASQSNVDWNDRSSQAILQRSAILAAGICKRYGIAVEKVTLEQLKSHTAIGFCGHVDVTEALTAGKGHTDPGVNFPWDAYLSLVSAAL